MTKREIYAKLEEIFLELFEQSIDIAKLGEDANLRTDLDMNSIGLLYMAMSIGEKMNVLFENDDFAKIITIGDVVRKIESSL